MSKSSELTFAPELDQPIRYIERTRSYYLGLGYDNPYIWAHYIDVPFAPLQKPLNQSVLGLITTAVPYDPAKGLQGPGAPYNAAAKFYRPYQNSVAGVISIYELLTLASIVKMPIWKRVIVGFRWRQQNKQFSPEECRRYHRIFMVYRLIVANAIL
jgi:hypothetical protein